ncbi:contactin-5-like [Haliotis cracherodii]|uniref:contactin-5-like n=1 Tax=Haliotis cracherodii TaxID=6455 RepID=UPI0039E7A65E
MKALKCVLHIAIVWIVLCRSAEGLTVIHEGGNVSLSWKQPDPPVREFSVLKSGICVFNVTDFDNITACDPRVEFTGNVTSDGAGVFSFVLLNVTQDDDGWYICYGGSPHHGGSMIAHCGEELNVVEVYATYGIHGEPLSISWNLPNPSIMEFTVMKSGECFFHVVNYNQVSKCGGFNGTFTGNITQSGSGVFSFDLPTLSRSDDGYFRCYFGSPNSIGTRIPACGKLVSDLEHPYIVGPDVPHPGEGLQLACHINIVVNGNRYHHTIASFTWWRNGVTLETGDRYSLSSTHAQWEPRVRYHISYLTINNVSMEDDTDNYTCQAQLDHRLRTEKSVPFTIGKKLPTELYMNYTLAREGGNATMVWKMPHQAVWFRIMNPKPSIMMSMLHDTVHVFQKFWTRIKITRIIVFPDSRALLLTMYNVMLTDAGHYRCDRWLCDNVLVVQKPPAKPFIHGSDAAVVRGNLRLTCISGAQSLPREYRQPLSYIWRGNSKLLERGGEYAMEGPHLIITDVNICHRGRYSCQTKERGLASVWSDDVSVDIIGPAPHVSAPVHATPGQTLTLTCSSPAWSRSRATHVAYTWRRNNVPVKSGGRYQMREGTLTITDARKEDEGTYSCRTEQDTLASDWSETTEVLILDPVPHVSAPVHATPGQTLTLTCSSPAWSRSRATHVAYTWRRNNVPVKSGGRYQLEEGTLTITDARKEDEGTYSCQTEQDTLASDWSETTEVLIWDPAPHVSAPVQATPGQTVTLTCSSPAWSRSQTTHVAYTWRRNNVQVKSGGRYQLEEGTLTITDARKEDEGTYSCQTEHDTLSSDWSETTEVLILAEQSHTTTVVAGACAAVFASAAVIIILLYKKMKRSVEIRYIPADSVRMSDIDQPDIYVSDQEMLIQD